MYGRDGTTWTERGKITAPDAADDDYFGGYSVALDGDTLLVSSYADDTPLPSFFSGYVVSGHGSVYIFRLSDVEISVEQPVGTNLTDGTATITFGDLNVGGTSQLKMFTIRNSGPTSLLGVAAIKD
ncbi:MAG: FG-GAP repeat protein [Prosthecobacter sp.]|uniref:FG-GAP repeat protein n=1 Tax=Prosthecobacter sp. TaxID=1965333 RepID=UPI0038FE5E89